MGTRFGVPLAAALGDALTAAVFGKFGLGPSKLPAIMGIDDRLRADAPQVSASLTFQIQWDDELFTTAGQLELFNLLGSPDNQLLVHRGRHGDTEDAAVEAWREFMATGLAR
ncbi:hypothetical protein MU582_19890 [Nocardioidaceae bacterium SCSIO 66511]|nr:hypothetical protein MU582_19890 [Nocardioidaceae bacterium SCSIO 66511]